MYAAKIVVMTVIILLLVTWRPPARRVRLDLNTIYLYRI
jgi:hypothetical protein